MSTFSRSENPFRITAVNPTSPTRLGQTRMLSRIIEAKIHLGPLGGGYSFSVDLLLHDGREISATDIFFPQVPAPAQNNAILFFSLYILFSEPHSYHAFDIPCTTFACGRIHEHTFLPC
jgi:hypothetical protein